MLKKFNLSSPLGIALTVAGVLFAFSPEARRTVRRLMVKGTAGVMDTMEQVGGITAGMVKPQAATWKSAPERVADPVTKGPNAVAPSEGSEPTERARQQEDTSSS